MEFEKLEGIDYEMTEEQMYDYVEYCRQNREFEDKCKDIDDKMWFNKAYKESSFVKPTYFN